MTRPAARRGSGPESGRSWARPPGADPSPPPQPAPTAPERSAADQARVDRLARALGLLLVGVLAVQLAVWGAFLVPFRVGGTLVPVSWAIAVVGNAALGLAAGRLGGRLVAALPGSIWVVLAMVLGSRRPEGDLVVDGGLVGMGFLALGAITSAVTYAVVAARPGPGPAGRASPGPAPRR